MVIIKILYLFFIFLANIYKNKAIYLIMDALDWKILDVLDWKGREPLNRIAQTVRSNKDVVAYRIRKMEEDNTLIRYFPILDTSKLGFHTYRLYLDLEEMTEKEEKAFVQFLDDEIRAGLIFKMDYSAYRYGVLIWVKSGYEVEEVVMKIKRKLGSSLSRYIHSLFCSFSVYPKDYLFGREHHENQFAFKPQGKVNHDLNDFRILQELSKNARTSTVKMAQALNLPQTTVSSKIRQMEKKGIILGYRGEINFIKLGYINYFLEIYLDTNDNLPQIEAWANQNKNVMWLQRVLGTCDIEIEVEVKNREELESLMNELRSTFKNFRKIIFYSQEYKKYTFLPVEGSSI